MSTLTELLFGGSSGAKGCSKREKLGLDFFSSKQRLYKHLGFNDRNRNGVIEAKKKSWLDKLPPGTQEGYGDANKWHSADINKDKKIDEREAWIYHYKKSQLMASEAFLNSELNNLSGKEFKNIKSFLDKVTGYLKPSKGLLAMFLVNVFLIGINKKNKEIVRYFVNFLSRCSENHKGIHPLLPIVGQLINRSKLSSSIDLLKNILARKFIKSRGSSRGKLLLLFRGIFGKKYFSVISNIPIIANNCNHKIAAIITALAYKTYKTENEEKKILTIFNNMLQHGSNKKEKGSNGVYGAYTFYLLEVDIGKKNFVKVLKYLLNDKRIYISSWAAKGLDQQKTSSDDENKIILSYALTNKKEYSYLAGQTEESFGSALMESIKKDPVIGNLGSMAKILLKKKVFSDRKNINKLKLLVCLSENQLEKAAKIGPAEVPLLSLLLSRGKGYLYEHPIRTKAANILAAIASPSAISALEENLKNGLMSYRTVEILGKNKSPLVVSLLNKALKDKWSETRVAAANSLARIGRPLAIPAIPALYNAYKVEKYKNEKASIMNSMLRLGDSKYVLKILRDGNSIYDSLDILKGLKVRHPKIIRALEAIVASNWKWKTKPKYDYSPSAAAGTILMISSDKSKLLNHRFHQVRFAAAEYLRKNGDKRAVPHLIARLKREFKRSIKEEIVKALIKLDALSELEGSMKSFSPKTKRWIWNNLLTYDYEAATRNKLCHFIIRTKYSLSDFKTIVVIDNSPSWRDVAQSKDYGGDGSALHDPLEIEIKQPKNISKQTKLIGIFVSYGYVYGANTNHKTAFGKISLKNGSKSTVAFRHSGQKTVFLPCRKVPEVLRAEVWQGDHYASVSLKDVALVYSKK
ncbi:MAG: HEAT repeat domain-containing protein [Candidatus Saganbacteria bacterium]|nr:HEAT repeat domain-containing protein [Candidatus Saganbacteria bacterium]